MKNKIFLTLTIIAGLLIQMSCTTETPTDLTKTSFIPKPVKITATGNEFELTKSTVIFVQDETQQSGEYLSNELNGIAGLKPEVKTTDKEPGKGIYISISEGENNLGEEGYELTIDKKLIRISANNSAGCFNGIQTLLQTLPVKANSDEELKIATGVIHDFPEYGFRGAMLDVARHFFDVEDVKRYIDFLAAYKMNVLHLHLSDDQGWRIEIKSWPNLTTYGGSTEVGGGEGGFYTHEQYAEIVNYALERNITIIPEIDLPGHTNAALASYAELNCDGKATELYTGTEVGFSTLCTDKEITYKFIDDVVRELAELSPGPYIHIGGDESHVTPMEDYIPFINRTQEIVVSHGKKVIGWDEIANASLVENATVQFWADVKNTTMGVEQGAKVIMSPAKKAYMDMQYDSTSTFGLHWAAYIEVDEGYSWNPATYVTGITKENILGIEAPLWSETVSEMDHIEYLVFPRLPGYAEIGWSAPATRNWGEYKLRLAHHGKRFDALDINFYRSALVPWE
ncbi:MAG: family 20 glycosylhydrolase [Prolixibacteraceae bacterium]|jgi:hexosaminidase|nr:family 20 glycosylhydrolase [Prolixibacteraceae bacterium]MBT6005845.1 family 20 glycosylhydrolase [Prolixibacteraceae bacterium]MBT6763943.1 family 20 glycosylhydrolase [Prolixibacteraceae bacterium]MBT6998797.1 family 20 glycosylhydrolase [Prolixibacteraceae bacterium]MBT7396269.1 family 20 glycosylhydrolase [Prolixibacteraceae bacterium]